MKRIAQFALFYTLFIGVGICSVLGLARVSYHKRFTQVHAYYKFAPLRRLGLRMENYNTGTVKLWFHMVWFSAYSFVKVEK